MDALSCIQWPEVSSEVLNRVMAVHLDNHPSAESFCYGQQAIPVELEHQEAHTLDQVIDWAQDQDQDPVIKSVKLRLQNKLRESELPHKQSPCGRKENIFHLLVVN